MATKAKLKAKRSSVAKKGWATRRNKAVNKAVGQAAAGKAEAAGETLNKVMPGRQKIFGVHKDVQWGVGRTPEQAEQAVNRAPTAREIQVDVLMRQIVESTPENARRAIEYALDTELQKGAARARSQEVAKSDGELILDFLNDATVIFDQMKNTKNSPLMVGYSTVQAIRRHLQQSMGNERMAQQMGRTHVARAS